MKLAVALAALLASAASFAEPAGKCDLTSDAGIDAAYKAATGHEMSTYGGRCVQRSTTFPSMIAIGAFESDYGCRWEGYLHGCAWNDKAAAAAEMAKAGWAKADAKQRGALAIAWLGEIEQLHPENATTSMVGGKLVVDFWVTSPVGMMPEPAPPPRTHHKVTVNADGTHGAVTTIK